MELFSVDSRPLYLQVAEGLKRYLDDGDFKAGDALPTVQELARKLGVSRSTLREALAFLEREGRLTRRHGVGTFVTDPPRSLLVSPMESITSIRAEATARGLTADVIEQETETLGRDGGKRRAPARARRHTSDPQPGNRRCRRAAGRVLRRALAARHRRSGRRFRQQCHHLRTSGQGA